MNSARPHALLTPSARTHPRLLCTLHRPAIASLPSPQRSLPYPPPLRKFRGSKFLHVRSVTSPFPRAVIPLLRPMSLSILRTFPSLPLLGVPLRYFSFPSSAESLPPGILPPSSTPRPRLCLSVNFRYHFRQKSRSLHDDRNPFSAHPTFRLPHHSRCRHEVNHLLHPAVVLLVTPPPRGQHDKVTTPPLPASHSPPSQLQSSDRQPTLPDPTTVPNRPSPLTAHSPIPDSSQQSFRELDEDLSYRTSQR